MCGLAASFASRVDTSPDLVAAMLRVANHRGPDGTGVIGLSQNRELTGTAESHVWGAVGQVRLAVVDLSDSNSQPMYSPCGRFILAFNGEIYNYRELRRDLVSTGHQFRTSGDTEVLLQALVKWGLDALPRLRGMFAFVFVDAQQRSVIAARDRYGIKPLYAWIDRDQIHFASEIKQFTAIPRWRARLNERRAVEYLLYGVTDHNQETMFADVQHVSPGVAIVLKHDSLHTPKVIRWWNPTREHFSGSLEESSAIYRDLFKESLKLHLGADVPIASCLSGGLDSSAIVGAVSQWFPFRAAHHTFTASSENSAINEVHYAESVNSFSGATGHVTTPRISQLWCDLEQLVWHQDEPFPTTSIFAQWCVFREVQRFGIKVALDGQGADEQLAGYNSFINLKVLSDIERGRLLRALLSLQSFSRSSRLRPSTVLSAIAYRYLPRHLRKISGGLAGVMSQNSSLWLNPNVVKAVDPCDPFLINGKHPKTIGEMSRDMVDRSNLPMLLRFEDRNSMAFGIEARVPFVDHVLMEFALTLPEEHLIGDGLTKLVLRKAVDDCLPVFVSSRKDKIGFQTDEHAWMIQSRDEVLQIFDSNVGLAGDLFGPATRAAINQSLQKNNRYNGLAWKVVGFLLWMKVFDVEYR